jgi:hypothetical protein
MEGTRQNQSVDLDVIHGSESLVTERVAGKLFQATWIPVVIEFSIWLKERDQRSAAESISALRRGCFRKFEI